MEKETATVTAREAVYTYLISLLRSSVNGEPAPEKPENVLWEAVLRESRRQSVSLLVRNAIKNLNDGPQGNYAGEWQNYCAKLIIKGANQSLACKELTDAFDAAGLRMLPMKGYYIRAAYPAPELREMTDLDLFVGNSTSKPVRELMEKLGYSLMTTQDVHSEYIRPPFLLVELHDELLPEFTGRKDYYRDVWKKTVPEKDRPNICHMSASDTFIHIMLHFIKHYAQYTGGGIRFVIDFFTFCRHYEKELDWTYIWSELDSLGERKLAEDVLGLGQAWFGDGELTERQRLMAARMCEFGTFGTKDGYVYNQIERLTPKNGSIRLGRIRYFCYVAFPPLREMKLGYPILNKAPILLPFTWIARGLRTVFKNPKHISEQYSIAKNTNDPKKS